MALWIRLTIAAGVLACAAASARAGKAPESFNGFDLSAASVPVQAIERQALQTRIACWGWPWVRMRGPIRSAILNWHEVVNDRFGDRAVVVTFCPLCGTGMAFDAQVGARSLGFGVSGLLYNSDVLLYDRATLSLWSQIMQTAVSGPLKGTRLQSLPLAHTSWADWRRRYPATQVLSTETGFERDYARDPYAGYGQVPRLIFDVQHRDDRFPLKEWVLGVRVADVHKAYRSVSWRAPWANAASWSTPWPVRSCASASTQRDWITAKAKP